MKRPVTKRVFLTGGTAGIGRATALLLAAKGHYVCIIGRSADKLEDFLKDVTHRNLRQNIGYLLHDLTDQETLERLLPEIWAEYGPFDVLINNAALGFGGVYGAQIYPLSYMTKTNIDAYLLLSGFFAQQMVESNIAGDIINIGSMSADSREGKSSGYVASKAGIQGFTEALRKELNPKNIRVSLIEPGAVGTDMQPSSPEEQRVLQQKLEMLKAEDIAEAIDYVLARDRRVSIVSMQIKALKQFI